MKKIECYVIWTYEQPSNHKFALITKKPTSVTDRTYQNN